MGASLWNAKLPIPTLSNKIPVWNGDKFGQFVYVPLKVQVLYLSFFSPQEGTFLGQKSIHKECMVFVCCVMPKPFAMTAQAPSIGTSKHLGTFLEINISHCFRIPFKFHSSSIPLHFSPFGILCPLSPFGPNGQVN
jgi:hypothetical protein